MERMCAMAHKWRCLASRHLHPALKGHSLMGVLGHHVAPEHMLARLLQLHLLARQQHLRVHDEGQGRFQGLRESLGMQSTNWYIQLVHCNALIRHEHTITNRLLSG